MPINGCRQGNVNSWLQDWWHRHSCAAGILMMTHIDLSWHVHFTIGENNAYEGLAGSFTAYAHLPLKPGVII
jgi:hypothetical protein